MSNRSIGTGAVCALLLLSAPGTATTAAIPERTAAEAPLWTAVAASGDVTCGAPSIAEADWARVQRGAELAPHALLRTGRGGRATLTRGASVVIVDPQSRLELPERVSAQGGTSIVQGQGSVIYRVERRGERHFEVVTPHLVAGVKGTTFLVTVGDGHSSVTVESGSVEVRDPASGATAELGPGQSLFLDEGADGFARFDHPESSPRARREHQRLTRMRERDERGEPERPREEQARSDGHDASRSDWAAGAGDAQAEDWKRDAGKGDTGWEDEAFQDHKRDGGEDDGKGGGEDDPFDPPGDDGHGKDEPPDGGGVGIGGPPEDDPSADEPPDDDAVPVQGGGRGRLDLN